MMADRYPRARTARHPQDGDVYEDFAIASALVVMALAAVAWAAGELSARLGSGRWAEVGADDMGAVVLRLAGDPGNPPAAFPAEARALIPGAAGYWVTFVVLLALLAGCGVAGRVAISRVAASNQGRDGQGWARTSHLRRLRVPQSVPGRLVLGRHGAGLLAAEAGQSVIVLGPTQSLKTTGLAVPAILEWDGPVLATSVKTDLVRDTHGWRERHGSVWVYDPSGATGLARSRWSPLADCGTWEGALRTAHRLAAIARDDSVGDQGTDFWHATAAKLLAPYMFAAERSGRTMRDVVAWLNAQDQREVLATLHVAGVEAAVSAARASFGREDRQKSSVYTTAETILRAFDDPTVADSASGYDIDLDALVDPADGNDRTLYVCAPPHEQRRLRPLFSTLVAQAIGAAYEHAARSGGALPRPLLVVLDEAANIAPLADLDALASTAAGNGVQLVSVFQDLAQIQARYGSRTWTVVNNHRAKIVLSGVSDPTTLDWASRLLGDEEVQQTAETRDESGGRSRTLSPTNRRLAPAEILRQVAPGEGILVYGHLPPARLRLRPWFGDRALRRRVLRRARSSRARDYAAEPSAAPSTLRFSTDSLGLIDPTTLPGSSRGLEGCQQPRVEAVASESLGEPPGDALATPGEGRASASGPSTSNGSTGRLLGDVEVAKVLGISRSGVSYRWRNDKLPSVRVTEEGRLRRKMLLTDLARIVKRTPAEVAAMLAEQTPDHATSAEEANAHPSGGVP